MKNLFLIIGAPGSGKTTDASLIAEKNENIKHYSTGDLLREEVAKGSELGKQIDSFISKGNLVPLSVVINTIINAIENSNKEIVIIDGYPRSVEQMVELDKVLKENQKIKLNAVIEVVVSEKVARERVLGRARGADDNIEVFNNRMKVFMQPREEIKEFYTKENLFHEINGERTIEEIVNDMDNLIKKIIKG